MPTKELILPPLHPKQKAFVMDDTRITLCESGTKAGKSVAGALWLVHEGWNQSQTAASIYAPTYAQAFIDYENCLKFLPLEERETNKTELFIRISNGSTIKAWSAEKPDNLYGYENHRALIDEAPRMREAAWHAIRTTVSKTKGPLKIIGNPKGTKNWFYLLCAKGKDPTETEFSYHHMVSSDNPYFPQEEMDRARETLPEIVFKELYLGEAQSDSRTVFPPAEQFADFQFEDYQRGFAYFTGYDPARTMDYAVACTVKLAGSQRGVVHFERLPRASWEQQIERVAAIASQYHSLVLMDSTGLGDPLYEWLVKRRVQVEPFKFTNETKQQLIQHLAVDMEHSRVHYPEIPELISELNIFDYKLTQSGKVTYSAPEGAHDDCVIALALADWAADKFAYAHPDELGVMVV